VRCNYYLRLTLLLAQETVSRKMSDPKADSLSPGSPLSNDSDSDSSQEEIEMVRLNEIKTVGEMFKSLALKPAASGKVKIKPNPELLDRVSLLWVLLVKALDLG